MTASRRLDWDGCFNARDLGGLRTRDGRLTRRGAAIRSDSLAGLTAVGWEALVAHGVRTVIDLRNEDELGDDAAPRPAEITTVHVPLDGVEHRDFWELWDGGPQFATPLYFGPHLERFPERSAAALRAIARAEPGGVAFHCVTGRDRAGQVTMLLLAMAGVEPEEIAADYALSAARLAARYRALVEEDQGPLIAEFLASRGTTAEGVIRETLASVDVEARLREGGLADSDVAALRERLLPVPATRPR